MAGRMDGPWPCAAVGVLIRPFMERTMPSHCQVFPSLPLVNEHQFKGMHIRHFYEIVVELAK